MAILAFIVVFGLLVIAHEFGHFYFAKRAGILVREFSIGFGPKIFHHHAGETSYTLRLLPLGGYVRLAGAEEEADIQVGMPVSLELDSQGRVQLINTSSKDLASDALPLEVTAYDLVHDLYIEGYSPGQEGVRRYQVDRTAEVIEADGTYVQVAPIDRQIQSAPVLTRMLVNVAGPLNNFILAIVLFIAMAFVQGGVPINHAQIGQIMEGGPAAQSELQEGDQVQAVNGQAVESWTDFSQIIAEHPDEELTLDLNRQGKELSIDLKTQAEVLEGSDQKIGKIGVMAPMNSSFWAKISYGFTATYQNIKGLLMSLFQMITGQFSIDQLGGPVAIFALTGSAVQQGARALLNFAAYLSINLGIINLLPIPALDGGKILFNIIEGVRGKAVSREFEGWVTLIGVGLIFILMIAVTWNDIHRFFF